VAADAQEILVVNLAPLGCIPALLTLFHGSSADEYDLNGCLKKLNLITDTHNRMLDEEIIKLRAKYPSIYLYYGDVHGVYSDILREPSKYSKSLALNQTTRKTINLMMALYCELLSITFRYHPCVWRLLDVVCKCDWRIILHMSCSESLWEIKGLP